MIYTAESSRLLSIRSGILFGDPPPGQRGMPPDEPRRLGRGGGRGARLPDDLPLPV